MVDQVEVFFHSQQPYVHVREEDISQYDSGRLGFPNTYFDPEKAHVLYNQYHEQYSFADEAGVDGIMTNEHHSAYWNMKPSANLDAAGRYAPRGPACGGRHSRGSPCRSLGPGSHTGRYSASVPGGRRRRE